MLNGNQANIFDVNGLAGRQLQIDPALLRPKSDLLKRVTLHPEFLDRNRLWFKQPQKCRILMYRDSHQFLGVGFGLEHVIDALQADPWPWAKFEVTTANRGPDGTADIDNVTLTGLDLDNYDQLWLFGFGSALGVLDVAEIAAVESFMDDGGGVLTTGDHANLGRSLSGPLKRVGEMRGYGADAIPTNNDRHTTLRPAGFNQSDNTAQDIRVQYWYSFSGGSLDKFPHPVLCADQGALRRLPDHQHEGVVTIPNNLPVADWPKVGPVQPRPEVIAWAKVVQPGVAKTGQEFPVIGAYDGHRVNVGRIVADATWHHWFDINLDGFDTTTQDYKDIVSYFQNCAAWLAPKHKQNGMRNGVFWLALHEASLAEVSLDNLTLAVAVKTAKDALGRWAPQCLVHGWLLPFIASPLLPSLVTTDPAGPRVRQAVEDIALVEALSTLQKDFDLASGVLRPPASFTAVDEALAASVPQAVARVVKMCEDEMKAVTALSDQLDALSIDPVVNFDLGTADGTDGAEATEKPKASRSNRRAKAKASADA